MAAKRIPWLLALSASYVLVTLIVLVVFLFFETGSRSMLTATLLQKIVDELYPMASMTRYFLVAVGGGIGSLMRFAIAQWVFRCRSGDRWGF